MSKSGDCSGAKTERETEWTWGSSDVKNWVRKLTESTRVNCSDVQKWQESEKVKSEKKKVRVRKRVRKRGKKNWVRKLTESTRVNCCDVQTWQKKWQSEKVRKKTGEKRGWNKKLSEKTNWVNQSQLQWSPKVTRKWKSEKVKKRWKEGRENWS